MKKFLRTTKIYLKSLTKEEIYAKRHVKQK